MAAERDNRMTRRWLVDAGVTDGMRVIEVGCGGGEVTQILAELVGPSGSVVAFDRDQEALAIAHDRMRERRIEHVQFRSADVAEECSTLESFQEESFDALAGRRVLMYLRNPAEVLRRLSGWLRSGGLVVFEETDSTMVPARRSPMPAHDRATQWLARMLAAEGANPAMGFDLPSTLAEAGLTFERIRAEAVIQGQGTQYPLRDLLGLLRSRLITAGVATQAEVDALAAGLEAESLDRTSVYVSEMSFCAWGRKP
ncbi:MAG: methyltransferase domain-containing protein [Deltaproteobacteria bacterium]|nr:methyltransferase domain-containing protein [Deltaproteobacteria bacterium]